jgi:prepilin-type processing-associated H-X9-DG protein
MQAAGLATGANSKACVSWTVPILAELGNNAIFDWYDQYVADQDDVTTKKIPIYHCPTSSADMKNGSALCYGVNAGTAAEELSGSGSPYSQYRGDGVFLDSAGNLASADYHDATRQIYGSSKASLSHVTVGDGDSSTLMLAERCGPYSELADIVWSANPLASGTGGNFVLESHTFGHPVALNASGAGSFPGKSSEYRVINPTSETRPLRGTDFPFRYPSSRHRGKGVNVVFCDGHIRFLSEKIDSWVYCQLLTSSKNGLSERATKWQQYDHDSTTSTALKNYIFDDQDLDK